MQKRNDKSRYARGFPKHPKMSEFKKKAMKTKKTWCRSRNTRRIERERAGSKAKWDREGQKKEIKKQKREKRQKKERDKTGDRGKRRSRRTEIDQKGSGENKETTNQREWCRTKKKKKIGKEKEKNESNEREREKWQRKKEKKPIQ